ncbi:MAG: protein jag [Acidobacteriota bacterium]
MTNNQPQFEGKTLREALKKAAEYYQTIPSSLDYQILEQESRGLWGRRVTRVKISAHPKFQRADRREPLIRELEDFLRNLLRLTRLELNIDIKTTDRRIDINLYGRDRYILLARKGECLNSLQFILYRIFLQNQQEKKILRLDSEGFRTDREKELRSLALKTAALVTESRKPYTMEPMNPYERRLIHLALKEHREVTTMSEGEGFIKRVTILPTRD